MNVAFRPCLRRFHNMERRLVVLLIALAAGLGGCVSVNQQMNAAHKKLADALPKHRAEQGQMPFSGMPWQVGQWAIYAQRTDEVWVTQRVAIVGKDEGGHWLEIETTDPRNGPEANPARIKCQISGYNAADPRSVKQLTLGAVITQHGKGKAMRAPPFIGPLTGGWVLSAFSIDVSKGKAETTTSPAGTFRGAVKIRTNTKWGPIHVEADSWLHSAVPVWGIVRSKSTDGSNEQRLLDFGLNGATSRIEGPVLGM